MYSDDPIADFFAHEARREEKRAKLPVCEVCGEPITDDCLYDLGGELICEECMNSFRRYTDNYIGE